MKNIFNKFISFIKVINLKQFLFPLLIIVAILGVSGSYYFYEKYSAIRANPNLEAQKETEALVLAVGKLIELPVDETPTVANIIDKEKLKDQPFFKLAENGDVLLAYTKAMQAILYRPNTNKIINVAPINLNGNTAETPVTKQNTSVSASDIKVAPMPTGEVRPDADILIISGQ